jgi:hypothetical protein
VAFHGGEWRRRRRQIILSKDPNDPVRGTIVAAPKVVPAQERMTLGVTFPEPEKDERFAHWWLRVTEEEAVFFAVEAKCQELIPSDLFHQLWRS